MIKCLIGGSPCQHWSVAQKNNRETEPSGIGWELFKNYLIAKEKFKPDFFLYENNKSAAQPIKDQISKELGVELQYINSALVSAQNRQRFYAHNIPNVPQPEDRGILLRDILESSTNEKAYPLNDQDLKSRTLKAQYGNTSIANLNYSASYGATMVAEPVCLRYERTEEAKKLRKQYENHEIHHGFNEFRTLQPRTDGKSNTISTVQKDNMIAEPVRVGDFPNGKGEISGSQATRIYSINGKSVNLVANGGGQGAKTGLYAVPIQTDINGKSRPLQASYYKYAASDSVKDANPRTGVVEPYTGQEKPIYEVRNGLITIKDKQYPIKLQDGFYIIRKLTVTECCRLQGMPDWWFDDAEGNKIISNTQCYKGLGNGWQLDTVKHIMSYLPIDKNEEILCISMYDGIGTGRRILEELGYANVTYVAYEIDKYCVKLTSYRYPSIIHKGDAFQVRNDDWRLI